MDPLRESVTRKPAPCLPIDLPLKLTELRVGVLLGIGGGGSGLTGGNVLLLSVGQTNARHADRGTLEGLHGTLSREGIDEVSKGDRMALVVVIEAHVLEALDTKGEEEEISNKAHDKNRRRVEMWPQKTTKKRGGGGRLATTQTRHK